MKKKIIISCIAVGLLAVIAAVGIGAGANYTLKYPRQEAYGDNWAQNHEAAPTKTIKKEESAKLDKAAVLSGKQSAATLSANAEIKDEVLTYAVTNTMEEDNPLDVYRDSKFNEYRYNQKGELDTYHQSLTDKKDLEPGEERCTKEESIKLAWAYLQKLYGDRIEGVSLNYCRDAGQDQQDYDIDFDLKYGVDDFIAGPGAFVIIRSNGDLGAATIADDMMRDFDSACVANLTKEMVAAQIMPEFEDKVESYIPESVEVGNVYLERYEDGFRLRVYVGYMFEDESYGSEELYYDLY